MKRSRPEPHGSKPLDVFDVTVTPAERPRSWPLIAAFAPLFNGTREVLERLRSVPNDDDPDDGRENAADMGRRAGRVDARYGDLTGPENPVDGYYEMRGDERARHELARGAEER